MRGKLGFHTIQQWWGNTVFAETADWNSLPWKTVEKPFGSVPFLNLNLAAPRSNGMAYIGRKFGRNMDFLL